MGSKSQQTFAKMERERKVKERRARKQEKKQAAAAEKNAQATDGDGIPAVNVPDEFEPGG